MRRGLGRVGFKAAWLGALLVAACEDSVATTPVGFASGGFNTAGVSAGGSTTIENIPGPDLPTICSAPALHFPLRRYSVADIDGSLDLVFGSGTPRLADAFRGDSGVGYDRELSPRLITALLAVAQARAQEAALGACSDADCLESWLRRYGDQLYRRPLAREQVEAYRVPFLGAESEEQLRRVAVEVLSAMVLSPYFLFRLEVGTGGDRISAHDVASRLAHLATRRVPDAELSAKAASGELLDRAVRLAQLQRLWRTPAGRAARELQMLEWLGIASTPGDAADEWQSAGARLHQPRVRRGRGAIFGFFRELAAAAERFTGGSLWATAARYREARTRRARPSAVRGAAVHGLVLDALPTAKPARSGPEVFAPVHRSSHPDTGSPRRAAPGGGDPAPEPASRRR